MKRYIKSATIDPLSESIPDQCMIAQNTDDLDVLMRIYNSNPRAHVLEAILNNPICPKEILIKHICNRHFLISLAADPSTAPHVLREIYNFTESPNDLEYLAQNPNTPSEILSDLYEEYPRFRGYIAMNPNISPELLDSCINSFASRIRSSAANNPKISVEDLIKLSTDSSEDVRGAVASNFNTPVDVLHTLLQDEFNCPRFCARQTLQELGEL